MNFMGIGTMELFVIFLVAFLALGPGRSVEMARSIGKFVRDMQRTFNEITSSVRLEDLDRDPSPRSEGTGNRPRPDGTGPPPGQGPAGSVPREQADADDASYGRRE
jgi:Sec-independent protein translocase protein TatA